LKPNLVKRFIEPIFIYQKYAATLSITTFSITTFSITTIQHNGHYCAHKSFQYSSIQVMFCYASSVILSVTFFIVKLSFVMLNVRARFITFLKVRLHWQLLLQKRNQKRQFHIIMSPLLSLALSPTKLGCG
jgi:hypothetical protein